MKKLVEFLIKNIVDNPKSVKISEETENEVSVIKVSVAKEDMGKVIGKSGRIIKSIRNLVKIKGIKEKNKAFVQLLDTDE